MEELETTPVYSPDALNKGEKDKSYLAFDLYAYSVKLLHRSNYIQLISLHRPFSVKKYCLPLPVNDVYQLDIFEFLRCFNAANNFGELPCHRPQPLFSRSFFQGAIYEPKCISYNYQRSGAENGVCELNDSGVENLCDRDELLIYSSGFVFQQIRKIKVSIYWLHVHFNCGKVGRLYYDEATKNFREGKLQ